MTPFLEQDSGGGGRASAAVVKLTPAKKSDVHAKKIREQEIARRLAGLAAREAFVQSLPKRTESRSPTPREFREMAYEEREAGLLRPESSTAAEVFAGLAAKIRGSEHYAVEMVKDSISDRIDAMMRKREVSGAELARRLGKSRAYVSKLLGGGENLTIETLVKIGSALGCELILDYALSTEGPSAPVPAPRLVVRGADANGFRPIGRANAREGTLKTRKRLVPAAKPRARPKAIA